MKAVANNDEQQLQNIYFICAREVNIKVGFFLLFQRQLKIVGVKFIQLQSSLSAKHFFIKRYLLYITKHFTPLYCTSRQHGKIAPSRCNFQGKVYLTIQPIFEVIY